MTKPCKGCVGDWPRFQMIDHNAQMHDEVYGTAFAACRNRVLELGRFLTRVEAIAVAKEACRQMFVLEYPKWYDGTPLTQEDDGVIQEQDNAISYRIAWGLKGESNEHEYHS